MNETLSSALTHCVRVSERHILHLEPSRCPFEFTGVSGIAYQRLLVEHLDHPLGTCRC